MPTWTARVEVTHEAHAADELDDVLDDLMVQLAEYAPAVALEDLENGGGCFSVVLTFEADTLRRAVASALELVEAAASEPASGISVLPAEVHDARGAGPP
jgi:hypothetical protein